MLTSTLRRPRWAMPSTAESRPSSAARSRIASRIGISDSAPSRPKRFWPRYLVREELLERLGGVEPARGCGAARRRSSSVDAPSTCSWIQRFSARAPGCACTRCRSCGSTRRAARARMSPSGMRLLPPTVRVDADIAAGEELAVEVPDASGRRWPGRARGASPAASAASGSRSAMRWPRTRYMLMSVATCICLSTMRGLAVDRVDVLAPLRRPRRARRASGRCRRRSRRSPSSSSWTFLRNRPDSAPWMMRWS